MSVVLMEPWAHLDSVQAGPATHSFTSTIPSDNGVPKLAYCADFSPAPTLGPDNAGGLYLLNTGGAGFYWFNRKAHGDVTRCYMQLYVRFEQHGTEPIFALGHNGQAQITVHTDSAGRLLIMSGANVLARSIARSLVASTWERIGLGVELLPTGGRVYLYIGDTCVINALDVPTQALAGVGINQVALYASARQKVFCGLVLTDSFERLPLVRLVCLNQMYPTSANGFTGTEGNTINGKTESLWASSADLTLPHRMPYVGWGMQTAEKPLAVAYEHQVSRTHGAPERRQVTYTIPLVAGRYSRTIDTWEQSDPSGGIVVPPATYSFYPNNPATGGAWLSNATTNSSSAYALTYKIE